MQVYLDL